MDADFEQHYQAAERVLQGDVDATIAALAEQGLKRCRSEDIPSGAGSTAATNGAIPDLLKDPFLSTEADQARSAPADVVTAMPWLSSDKEPRAVPTPDPSPTPVPSPEPTVTPEASSDVEVEVEMATQEPARSEEEPPVAVDPTPRSLLPKISWRTHGSAFNSSLKPKTPATPWNRWG